MTACESTPEVLGTYYVQLYLIDNDYKSWPRPIEHAQSALPFQCCYAMHKSWSRSSALSQSPLAPLWDTEKQWLTLDWLDIPIAVIDQFARMYPRRIVHGDPTRWLTHKYVLIRILLLSRYACKRHGKSCAHSTPLLQSLETPLIHHPNFNMGPLGKVKAYMEKLAYIQSETTHLIDCLKHWRDWSAIWSVLQ